MNFRKYIHAVGTGKKGNRDLSYEESQDMMTQILNRNVSNEEIAAFLLGWRLKPETIEEFQGALTSCDALIKKQELTNSIELGYPFDGKAKNPYIFPLVAKVLKESDLGLVVMGDDRQPAKGGITIKEIAQNENFPSNIHYFDRADYFKELHELTEVRNRVGLRSAFNTIEKLPHIMKSDYGITGVFHKPYVKKYIAIFAQRYKRFALIQGNEGTPELFSKGRLWIAQRDGVEEFIIDPQYYGVYYKKSWEKITLKESLHQLQNPSDEYMKLARLNAAIFLFITQKVNSIGEGYEHLNL